MNTKAKDRPATLEQYKAVQEHLNRQQLNKEIEYKKYRALAERQAQSDRAGK
jgi:hypothetical protein